MRILHLVNNCVSSLNLLCGVFHLEKILFRNAFLQYEYGRTYQKQV